MILKLIISFAALIVHYMLFLHNPVISYMPNLFLLILVICSLLIPDYAMYVAVLMGLYELVCVPAYFFDIVWYPVVAVAFTVNFKHAFKDRLIIWIAAFTLAFWLDAGMRGMVYIIQFQSIQFVHPLILISVWGASVILGIVLKTPYATKTN